MKQFAMTAAAAAAVMMMNPAFAADAAYEADLCVIGAGASGTAAAWAAAEKGMKVITLEKSGLPGGTGKYSEGIFAVESAMQRNWNYGLTKDEAFMKIMNYGHWRGNARMVRAFVDRSADTIDWMIKNGVKFEKLFSNYPNGLYTWHIYEGRGAGWINLFIDKYKKAGQTLLTNTWGQKLITENGRVVGVEATNKAGDKITIRSKATIIATGGFFDNKTMREKYLRFADADGLAQTGKTGDGIQMAWAVGGTMFVVYDQKTLDHMEKDQGIDLGVGVMVPVGTKLTEFQKDWDGAVQAGWAFKADTLDGLAKATGMNADKLKKTVAEYNGYCDVRHDAEFAKDPKYLREVKTGPFYAIKSVASSLGTLGGIKANERFEVVTPEEDPIPGLYAAGNDVGGMYGDSYDLLMAGSTVGFAVNSGRIAVDSAAEYIRTLK